MKYILLTLFLVISFSQEEQTRIAVLEFSNKAGSVTSDEIKILSERVETKLVQSQKYEILSASERDKILKEQKFQNTSGCVDDACIVEVGQMLGAEYLISGTVGKIGSVYLISAKMYKVETGKIFKAAEYYTQSGKIEELFFEGTNAIVSQLIGSNFNNAQQTQSQDSPDTPNLNKTGFLSVTTNPMGIDIKIDGEKLYQKTPIANYELAIGRHTVILTSDKFERISQGVIIIENETDELDIVMVEKQSEITINSNPSGATIFINGQYKGETPKEFLLTYGQYEIKLAKEFHIDEVFTLTADNEIIEVNKSLTPKLVNVTILTKPKKANADLFIDGKFRGKVKADGFDMKLMPGKYKVGLEADNFYTYEEKITIPPRRYAEKQFRLEKLEGNRKNKGIRKRGRFTIGVGASVGLPSGVNGNLRMRIKKFNIEWSTAFLYGNQIAFGLGKRNKTTSILLGRNNLIGYNYWGCSVKYLWKFLFADIGYMNTGDFYKSPHQLYLQLGLGLNFTF